MSSNVPTRRVTRTTRIPAKDIENANARPTRLATRAKPLASNTATASTLNAAGTTLLRATAASKAKAIASNIPTSSSNGAQNPSDLKADPLAGKRKREALGENNKPKSTLAATKGKEKEDVKKDKFDSVAVKKAGTTRQPLRTVVGSQRTAKPLVVKEEPKAQEENSTKPDNVMAMAIDIPAQQVSRVPIPSLNVRSSKDPAGVNSRRSPQRRAAPSRTAVRQAAKVEEEEDAENSRVFKKPRTSSETPADADDEARLAEEAREADRLYQLRVEEEIEIFANEVEADPESSNWEDLDADDADDPLMVSEYVNDIFNYLKEVELTTMPNPNYMATQRELAWNMRGILTDWLIQVHVRFRLLPETLFLTVNVIDRFLSARVVSLAKMQLVGITCMFVAAKFEEIIAPTVSNFIHCADSSYTESEILQAERYILKTLDWNLSYPNPVHYLRRVSKADEYNVKVRTLAKYLLEIGCLEWRLLAAPPSLLAAASIWLARVALGMENWTPNLAHYSSYSESAIIPTANLMINYILKPTQHMSFYKKYAGKRYFKASIYMREWALSRWEEGTRINLAQILPRLKAEIKIVRGMTEAKILEEEAAKLEEEGADFFDETRAAKVKGSEWTLGAPPDAIILGKNPARSGHAQRGGGVEEVVVQEEVKVKVQVREREPAAQATGQPKERRLRLRAQEKETSQQPQPKSHRFGFTYSHRA